MIFSMTPTILVAITSVTLDQDEKTIKQGDEAVFVVTVSNDNRSHARGNYVYDYSSGDLLYKLENNNTFK